MAQKQLAKDFTSGNIMKQLLLFAIPFVFSNALQVLYSTVDMVIVGNYVGTVGLSAVSLSSQIINFAAMVCLGVSNAGQVLVSQALGAGKKKELNSIIGTLFSIVCILAVILSLIVLIFRNPILKAIKVPAESYGMSIDYLIICSLGLIFTAGYNMFRLFFAEWAILKGRFCLLLLLR